jgi:hypothetical protein
MSRPPPGHPYLSAIRDLTSFDADEALRRKREQQAAFADTLRQQIEEKKRRKAEAHFTFGREKSPRAPSGLGLSDADLASTVVISPESKRPPPKPLRKQLLSRADLSQLEFFAKCDYPSRPPIPIATDNPLAASNVPTPPPGFSLRGIGIVEPTTRKPDLKQKSTESRSKTVLQPMKLAAESELIYFDGHHSPLPSPHCG